MTMITKVTVEEKGEKFYYPFNSREDAEIFSDMVIQMSMSFDGILPSVTIEEENDAD